MPEFERLFSVDELTVEKMPAVLPVNIPKDQIDPSTQLAFGTDVHAEPAIVSVASVTKLPRDRAAFARVPFPAYWGTTEDVYRDVTEADEKLVTPSNVRAGLGRTSIYAIRGIIFPPAEYVTVPLNVRAFAAKVGARTLRAQKPFEGVEEGKKPIDERSAEHALSGHLPKLEELASQYHDSGELMRWLRKEMPKHWLAHVREAELRRRVTQVRDGFSLMIDTIAGSEAWSQDKLAAARLAHNKRLLTGRLETKKTEWSELASASIYWTQGKDRVVQERIGQMRDWLRRAS